MIHIESDFSFPEELLERAAHAALEHEDESREADLSIVLTDNEHLQELNLNYLGIDAPTDVLSFPASETDPESGARYIGDILISVPRAQSQAEAAGHPLESEVQLLVVHGVLHLLGHDHADPEEKSRMWKAQAEILNSLGLGNIQIREE
jgi:probable rRNA maturation factor